jgi:hypothetical protein
MLRVCIALWILSIAACISSPEVTLVDETQHASVSPDGSAESIALVEDLGFDASEVATDGGVLPHPERDARADADANAESGGEPAGDEKPKGKPPGKKKP